MLYEKERKNSKVNIEIHINIQLQEIRDKSNGYTYHKEIIQYLYIEYTVFVPLNLHAFKHSNAVLSHLGIRNLVRLLSQ